VRDVGEVWRSAHVAVLPSYREGLPKALLEAAACERALLATDVPGCRAVVRSGENGLLVPPRRPDLLAWSPMSA
jgi:glycosyltransferase involved in cell wall biosynthesis